MMKKIFVLFLATALVLNLFGCAAETSAADAPAATAEAPSFQVPVSPEREKARASAADLSFTAVDYGEALIGIRSDGSVIALYAEDLATQNMSFFMSPIDISQLASDEEYKSAFEAYRFGHGPLALTSAAVAWTDIVSVSSTSLAVLGVKADGSVYVFPLSADGNPDLYEPIMAWTDIVSVDSYQLWTVGLKSDGTVVSTVGNKEMAKKLDTWCDIVDLHFNAYTVVGRKANGEILAISFDGEHNLSSWQNVTALAVGRNHVLGLTAEGTVLSSGDNEFGQCDVSDWTDIIAIEAGEFSSWGLRSDGTVLVTGEYGEKFKSEMTALTGVESIQINAVGIPFGHSIEEESGDTICIMKDDGTLLLRDFSGRAEKFYQYILQWDDVYDISTGALHTLGLKADGTAVAYGDNHYQQCDVAGWSDLVYIQAGKQHSLGLRADGTVVAVGSNDNAECEVSEWREIVDIAGGDSVSFGLKADGTVVCAGNAYPHGDTLAGWHDIVQIEYAANELIGVTKDGTILSITDK